jgi:hypothetical protein
MENTKKKAPRIETYGIAIAKRQDGSGDYDFEFTSGDKDRIECHNHGHDGLLMSFVIDEEKNESDLRFPVDAAKALCVRTVFKDDDPCPKPGDTWEQFVPLLVAPTRNILIVENKNKGKNKYKFALNFEEPGGKAVSWDPIGENRNG